MIHAHVFIHLKKTVLDPQGKTIKHALEINGFETVEEIRVGKFIEITLNDDDPTVAAQKINQMCARLLSNPVIEDYRYEIVGED